MRELTTHKANECNDAISIKVMDEPGCGGACHEYEIEWPDSLVDQPGCGHYGGHSATIRFQNGPIKEVGTNGLTHEALLAILIDRLAAFQAGPYACEENAEALDCLQNAIVFLKRRTEKRLARGVEGTHEK
jgi:hypothetical protein